jgi:hypothetical protein
MQGPCDGRSGGAEVSSFRSQASSAVNTSKIFASQGKRNHFSAVKTTVDDDN